MFRHHFTQKVVCHSKHGTSKKEKANMQQTIDETPTSTFSSKFSTTKVCVVNKRFVPYSQQENPRHNVHKTKP
jgi:hypothetical protein